MYTNFSTTTMFDDFIIPKDLWKQCVDCANKKNFLLYNKLIKSVYPQNIKKYLKNKSYTLVDDNENITELKIIYDKLQNNYENFAYLQFEAQEQNKRMNIIRLLDIHITPCILMLPKRCIDSTIAHELAHAKRFVDNRYKTKLLDKTQLNITHEEYWADREIKKMLPIVDPKYNDKNERRKTLIARSIFLPRGGSGAAGIFSAFGKLTDVLRPFSNTPLDRTSIYR